MIKLSLTKQDLENAIRKAVAEALMAERSQVSQRSQGDSHHSMSSIDDCPECHAAFGVDKFKADTIRKNWEERKGLHAKCKNCGLPVKTKRDGFTAETQDQDCPSCHSTEAQDRYVWE